MWQVNMVKDTAKNLLPFQQQLRRLKRKVIPYVGNQANCRLAVLQGLQQIRLLRNAGVGLTGSSVFEHITPEVIEEIIWQCGRILRPQGAIVISWTKATIGSMTTRASAVLIFFGMRMVGSGG